MTYPRRALASIGAALACLAVAVWFGAGPVAAEVDPAGTGVAAAAWGASCVPPGTTIPYTVYGRDWSAGQGVDVRIGEPTRPPVASVVANPVNQPSHNPPRAGVFQITFYVSIPSPPPKQFELDASTPGGASSTQVLSISDSCRPTISAAPLQPCTQPGRPVATHFTSSGWQPGTTLKNYVDLYGATERIDPAGTGTGYDFTAGISASAGAVVPVTGEGGQTPAGASTTFTYATTYVTMPPVCQPPTTTTVPTTTTTPTTRPGPTTTAGPTTTIPITIPAPISGAQLLVTPSLGRPGETAHVHGAGFPALAPVVLRWEPGAGQWATTARADGSIDMWVVVLPKDPTGRRLLRGFTSVGVAPAPYLVVPGSEEPGGLSASVYYRN